MRKFGFFIMLLLFVLALPIVGQAASPATHIVLNGSEIDLSQDQQVQITNNSVMIPIRVVVEGLGFQVDWNKETKTVKIEQSDKTLELIVGSDIAFVNGEQVKLTAAAFVENGTTFVPIRFVSEQMGIAVDWDNTSKTVSLTSPNLGEDGGGTPPGGDSGSPDPNVASASLIGVSFSENRLTIAVDGKVSPVTSVLTNPDRVVVDLPKVRFASDFAAQYPLDAKQTGTIAVTDYPDVSQIRYSLFNNSPSTVRVVLDLNYAKKFNMTNIGDGLIVIDLNQGDTPSSEPNVPDHGGKKLVVIDAGHGGSDPGAISVTGRKEKDFTLAVVLKIEELLKKEPNIDYVLTRSGDTYPTLSDRSSLANKLKADAFVSIHGNSGPASASGVETFYTRSGASQTFAKIMHNYLVKATGLPDRKVHQESLHVTRETTMPAVLLECGFLSNKSDEAKMYSEDYQKRIAEGVVAGIKEFLGVQ